MSKPTLAIYGIKDRFTDNHPAYTHDHNLCLMQDGKILDYLHLERLSRRKYDNRMPYFIDDILDNHFSYLKNEDFDLVIVNSFVGSSFISDSGRFRFEPSIITNSFTGDTYNGKAYYQTEKWKGKEIEAFGISHELAHVSTCLPFYGEFLENSLLVHFDGGASIGNFSAFIFKNGIISPIEAHWELSKYSKLFNDNGLSFAIINALPGEHTSVPGKLMGYAAFGKPNIDLTKWLKENDYFTNLWNFEDRTKFVFELKNRFGGNFNHFDQQQSIFKDIASVFQAEFQNAIVNKLTELQEKYKTDHLYYAGGGALNITTNSAIVRSNLFKTVNIPPSCNDSGLSLGAAAFHERKKGNRIALHSPYLNSLNAELNYDFTMGTIDFVTDMLIKNKVVGICNGYGEAGPRSLGNRSIIALANSKELTEKVSMIHKKREWYRPLAPIMLNRNIDKFTDQSTNCKLAEYMLLDFDIYKDKQDAISGVVHANSTARIQSISNKEQNPFMYHVLDAMEIKFGQMALINTSFNSAGEPIVQTKEDALKSATDMKLDALVIDGKLKIL